MNKKEIENKIEELKNKVNQQLEELKKGLNSPKFEKQKNVRWQPILGQHYFYLDDGGVVRCVEWQYDDEDIFRFNTGNCFKTEQEAEDYKENLLTKQQLKDLALELNEEVESDWKNDNQHKYYIYFDYFTSELSQCWYSHAKDFNIYCLRYDFITIAKERIGEEKLIKLIKSGV